MISVCAYLLIMLMPKTGRECIRGECQNKSDVSAKKGILASKTFVTPPARSQSNLGTDAGVL